MVTVVMTTYNPEPNAPRFQYASQCLYSWREHLYAPGVPIKYLVADDGSPGGYDTKESLTYLMHHGRSGVEFITGEHGGVGASLNRALQFVAEPWIYTTDDWVLVDTLDLTLPMALLAQGYDYVRLGPIHPNLTCYTKFTHGIGWWLELDTQAGGFVFATRPFLAAPSMLNMVGPFDEGINAYEVERLFSLRFSAAGCRAAAVALAGPWDHIGEYEVGDRPVVGGWAT